MASNRQKDNTQMAGRLFKDICDRFSLLYERDDAAPVELCINVPKQHGLRFAIRLMLQNKDELWFCTDGFTMSCFPCSNGKVVEDFARNVLDVISGQARLLEYRWRKKQVYKTVLQRFDGHEWKDSYTYRAGFVAALVAAVCPSMVEQRVQSNCI